MSPVVLLCLPADFFDKSTVNLCLSKICFNRECFACGTTRAVMHFIHLDFKTAWHFNKLVVLVVPFLLYLWVGEIRRCLKLLKAAG
ncbi:MAG TPA: DUF2752 domain-containing protein [Bacteroidales bacterium]|nr:DUF2752 domain-containing protein [Bacteroidales bacterium]HPT01229.1 DUF2752 domain-containing protein [Bacteroidales bacterium]